VSDTQNPPLIIGGTGRSGTTIFARACGLHPDVMLMPEFRFMTDPGGLVHLVDHIDLGNPHSLAQAYEDFVKVVDDLCAESRVRSGILRRINPYFARRMDRRYSTFTPSKLPFDLEKHLRELLEEIAGVRWSGRYSGLRQWHKKTVTLPVWDRRQLLEMIQAFFRDLVRDALTASGKSYFVEKNTWNILHFRNLCEFFPDSKLVHIVRDPRDTVASYLQQAWMPNDAVDAARILRGMLEKWWRDSDGQENFLELRLEDFTADPPAVMQSACDFWGLPFAEEMVGLDLSKGNKGRWRKAFSDAEIQEMAPILAPICERYGYDT